MIIRVLRLRGLGVLLRLVIPSASFGLAVCVLSRVHGVLILGVIIFIVFFGLLLLIVIIFVFVVILNVVFKLVA